MDNLSKIAKGKVISVQGGKHATYDGLLDLAHKEGLVTLECKLIQPPSQENGNTAICEARATFIVNGETRIFADIGDANPTNTNKQIGIHIIRMASTRAKGRVLRDALNIDGCTADELVDYVPEMHEEGAPKAESKSTKKNPAKPADGGIDKATMDELQVQFIRAGWGIDKARAELEKAYKKQSRSMLTQAEGERFLEALKTLPDADAATQAVAASSLGAPIKEAA